MMRVEFLYFDDCPGHEATWDILQEEVANLGIPAKVERIRVMSPDEAPSHRFLGSPSIRINGIDLEGVAFEHETGYGWRCRLYLDSEPGRSKSVPSRALIRRRLEESR